MQGRLAAVRNALKRASFVAMDAEFSGLTAPGNAPPQTLDDSQQVYSKARYSVKQLAMMQFGFCCFHYDATANRFVVEPFSFYLLQTPIRGCGEKHFVSQNSSIKFLADNNFDFNKCFREGVSYLNIPDEENVRKRLQRFGELDMAPGNEDNEKECAEIARQVSEWLANSPEDEKSKVFPSSNGFMKALLAMELPKRVGSISAVTAGREPGVNVTKLSEDEAAVAAARRAERTAAQTNLMEEAIGLRRVLEAITESGLPVLGHNMFLDALHIVDKLHKPLPDTVIEFKSMISTVFPTIVDTKILALMAPEVNGGFTEGTYLKGAFDTLSKTSDLKFVFEVDGKVSEIAEQCHDAAYDAFMTGAIYAQIAATIGKARSAEFEGTLPPTHDLITPYRNRIHLMRTILTALDLTQEQDAVDLSNAVLASGFGLEVKTAHLLDMFRDVGGCTVSWVDDATAVCFLNNPSRKPDALAKSSDKVIVSAVTTLEEVLAARKSTEEEEPRRQTLIMDQLHPTNNSKHAAATAVPSADGEEGSGPSGKRARTSGAEAGGGMDTTS